jgi:prolyl oligopeptidase
MSILIRAFLAIFFLSQAALSQSPGLPATPKHPISDTYHGLTVTDDYRWLENWEDPQVKQWSAAENIYARHYLDHLSSRPAIVQRLQELTSASSASYFNLQFRGGTLFAMKFQPPLQQDILVALRSADDSASAKVVFDPNADASKGSLAVDFYVPSHDGKYVVVALCLNGSEDSSADIFEVATGKALFDVVSRVNFATAGGSVEWNADGTGFYYTRYPQEGERPPEDAYFYQQVYFHKLGTDPKLDSYVIGKDFPRIQLHASDDARWLIASVANGDGAEFVHFVMDYAGHWTQITHFANGIVAAKPGPDGNLYLLSRLNAPRGQIFTVPLAHPDLAHAKLIVPQSPGSVTDEYARASVQDFVPAPGHLYVVDIIGGPSRIRVFDDQGHSLPAPPLPPVSSVSQLLSIGWR